MCEDNQDAEKPFPAAREALIADHWRWLGYVIPAPQLSLKDRDDMARELGKVLKDSEDWFYGKSGSWGSRAPAEPASARA